VVDPNEARILAAMHAFLLPGAGDGKPGAGEGAAEARGELLAAGAEGLAALVSLPKDRERATRAGVALALAFTRWLQERNQFVRVPREGARALAVAMARSAQELALAARGEEAGAALDVAAAAHGRRMDEWLQRWLGGLPQEVPAAEYSVELQLELLGIDPAGLLGPVLDLGCGREASLVHHLRGLGIEAYGIDPLGASEWVIGRDWLDFPFEPETWGTVISHQGFSLHFLHHHFREGEMALHHGRAYMRVLGSLVRGGRFIYVPSLPFLEALLQEDAYEVERRALPAALGEGLSWVREADPALDVASVTTVRKR
jgi:hypothetical protein